MPLSFSLPTLPIAGGIPNPNEITEESLKRVGFNLASNQIDEKYQFSRMGGWNVTVRASIIRITFFKLFGTGVVAAFVALSPHVGSYTSWSLAMSAAVNLVACGHYWYIWQTRLQTYRGPAYDAFMSKVGRAPAEDQSLVAKEEDDDSRKIYFQELTVDGLRHSDWLCTLVLMTLDLGHLRAYLYYATQGAIPDMPIVKEWVACMQAAMIFFASIWRFYTNEGKSILQPDGSHKPPTLCTVVLAWGSFLISCVLFGFIVWALLDGLPLTPNTFSSNINSDVACLYVLVLVWLGYPLTAMMSRLGHWGVAGSDYSATWSMLKDLAYASLDITSKGGLALYFVLKASWIDGQTEDALVATGKIVLIGRM